MKLSDTHPGDLLVDKHGYLCRVLAHDVKVDGDRRLTEDTMADLSIAVATGKGGSRPQVSFAGRGSWTTLKGMLTTGCSWTAPHPAKGYGFTIHTTGHDLRPLATFLSEWSRRSTWYLTEGTRCIAFENPRPSVDERRITSQAPYSDPALIAKHVVYIDVERNPDHPWLGPEGDPRPATVETPDGARWRIGRRYLCRDDHGVNLDLYEKRLDEVATAGVRGRLRDALRAVARGIDVDVRQITVDVDSATIPLAVLEALVLGDEFGIAALLDGSAELRDVLADSRAARTEGATP